MFSFAFRRFLPRLAAFALCASALAGAAAARQQQTPLTNAEFLSLVRQLPQRPGTRDQLVAEIRRRGIGFTLTPGLRAFVATKSGNDAELRRVLEEAERRFVNPKEATPLPPEAETDALLEKARGATNEALQQMPDFVVKQLVTRSYAEGTTQNWKVSDRLVIGLTYRPSEGEKYRLLSINGVASASTSERNDYDQAGGSNSTGEFVYHLKGLFAEESHTEFKPLDMDTLRGRRAVVYSYDIKKANSHWILTDDNSGTSVIAGQRGKVWIDLERARVLRYELDAYDTPVTFPFKALEVALDYDWVTIPGQGDYLLPSHSLNVLTVAARGEVRQFRNDIRFRGYQKFGTELKILDDDIIDEDVPPEAPAPKPPGKKP